MATRQQLINYGVAYKKSRGDINKALAKSNFPALTGKELSYMKNMPLASDNPIARLGQNAIGDLGEMAKGLSTTGALAIQGARRLKQHPEQEVANLKKMATDYANKRGVKGIVEDVANIGLSTYNTKVSDFGKLPWQKIVSNVGQGIYENPLMFALDVAPATKLLPKGTTAGVRNVASKVTGNFVPTKQMNRVNEIIAQQKIMNEARLSPIQKTMSEISRNSKVDKAQLVRNVTHGEWEGNAHTLKATEKFTQANRDLNKIFHEDFGLDPKITKYEAVTKYILSKEPEKFKTVSDVKQAMASGQLDSDTTNLLDKASKLYDEQKISHVTEMFSTGKGANAPKADVNDIEFFTERMAGTATPEEIGEVLTDVYNYLGRQTNKSRSAMDSFNKITKETGIKVNPKDLAKLPDDKILVSPSMLKDMLRQGIGGNSIYQAKKKLESVAKGINPTNKTAIEKYGSDIYAVDKKLLKGLINSQTEMNPSQLNALFKTAQLSTTKWLAENRVGNTILNAIEGVSPASYAKAIATVKEVPEWLKGQTSYSGYLGENFMGSQTLQGMKNALQDIPKNVKEKDLKTLTFNLNRLSSAPIVGAESKFERIDRWANMIQQAKRYSKDKNIPLKDVIKRLNTDEDLFMELNKKVNNSLGDYVGKNYFINPAIHKVTNWAVPFYKFPTQSARVLAQQAINRPLSYQALVGLPEKFGRELYAEEAKKYNLPEDTLGGLVKEAGRNKYEPSILERFGANPMGAPLELGYQIGSGNWQDASSSLSPLFSDVAKIANFKDKYGRTLSSPKYMNIGDKTIVLDEQGRPTRTMFDKPVGEDYLKAIASMLGNRFSAGVVQANRDLLPFIAYMEGKKYYPQYDTTLMGNIEGKEIPFISQGKDTGRGKEGASELLLNRIGVRTTQEYPNRATASKAELRKAFRKYALQLKRKEGR